MKSRKERKAERRSSAMGNCCVQFGSLLPTKSSNSGRALWFYANPFASISNDGNIDVASAGIAELCQMYPEENSGVLPANSFSSMVRTGEVNRVSKSALSHDSPRAFRKRGKFSYMMNRDSSSGK